MKAELKLTKDKYKKIMSSVHRGSWPVDLADGCQILDTG
jgi:hypothetical protein